MLAIGLDGYDDALARRLMGEGRLPHLSRLYAESARFDLDHGAEKYSGLSWEHVSTGRSPELTGRWSAVEFDPDAYTVTQVATRQAPFAAAIDARMVVFDVPYFDLAQAPRVRGMVSWGAHDPGIQPQSNPPELREELRARFGEYDAAEFIYGFTWPDAVRTRKAGEALTRAVAQRSAAARWLFAERLPEWDIAMVVISEFHSVIEPMWHGVDPSHPLHHQPSAAASKEAVENVYAAADRMIGELAEAFPQATMIAFAMHGMGPNAADVPSMLLLSELLHRDQFGARLFETPSVWQSGTVPLLDVDVWWEEAVIRCLAHPPRIPSRTDASVLQRGADWLRGRLAPPMTAHRPTHDASAGESLDWMPATHYARYWPFMNAFALPSFYDARIRINLAGRERYGRVDPSAHHAECARLKTLLCECTDPATGEPVVAEVHGCSGDFMQLGMSDADLRIVWRGAPLGLQHPRLGRIGPLPYRRTGGHTGHYGVALCRGADVIPGYYGLRSSFDVVPTILELLAERSVCTVSGRSMLDAGFLRFARPASRSIPTIRPNHRT